MFQDYVRLFSYMLSTYVVRTCERGSVHTYAYVSVRVHISVRFVVSLSECVDTSL